jgi:hypothetical protein
MSHLSFLFQIRLDAGQFTLWIFNSSDEEDGEEEDNPGAAKVILPVLWIRIRKDPKLFAGSGSVTRGYGSGFGSETGLESY